MESTTIVVKDYSVTVRSDENWFTVYRGDKMVATIRRPERGQKAWTLWYPREDNQAVLYGVGPRTLLVRFARM